VDEELRQDRGEHARVYVVRLTRQHPQLAVRERLAQRPRRVRHERKARVARQYQGGHRDARGQLGRHGPRLAHDRGVVVGQRRSDGFHTRPERRAAHAVDLFGGRADEPHEQGHRVAPATFGQGLAELPEILAPGLLHARIVVVRGLVHGDLADLAA
jgi:hypothetical protein